MGTGSCSETVREVICDFANIQGAAQNCPRKNNLGGYSGAIFIADLRVKDHEHLNLKDSCTGSECIDQSCLFMALGLP